MKLIKNVATALLLTLFANTGYRQNWDIDLAKSINPAHSGSGYWKFTSASTCMISAAIPVGMLVSGYIKNDKTIKRKSIEVFAAIATEVIVSEVMKIGFGRRRPAEKYPNDIFPYKYSHGQSFPSGHTSLSFTTAASLSIQCKKWWVTIPAYLWAGSVCYSRVYLGVHYPSNVLMGRSRNW